MSLYWLKCRINTESKSPNVGKTRNRKIMLLPKCAVCDSKKLKFIKKPEVSGWLISLVIKTPLS